MESYNVKDFLSVFYRLDSTLVFFNFKCSYNESIKFDDYELLQLIYII